MDDRVRGADREEGIGSSRHCRLDGCTGMSLAAILSVNGGSCRWLVESWCREGA